MPGHVDEKLWREAKAAVLPRWAYYERTGDPWAVVNFIYRRKLAAHYRGEYECNDCALRALHHRLRTRGPLPSSPLKKKKP